MVVMGDEPGTGGASRHQLSNGATPEEPPSTLVALPRPPHGVLEPLLASLKAN